MAKKHWIYIKRGLSEDPKHRAAMAECIWLYMHIIDRADWETGIVHDWKDEVEAADMSLPVTTLRHQRRKLEELEYIICKQAQRSQDIIILEWINPRDYSGGVINKRVLGDNPLTPSEFQGDNQGDNEGDNHGSSGIVTPTYSSESKSSPLIKKRPELDLFVGYFGKFNSEKEIKRWQVIYEAVGKEKAESLIEWAFKKEIHLENRGGLLDSLETAAKNWKSDRPKGVPHANRNTDHSKRTEPSAEQDEANRAVAAQVLAERAARQATRV